MSTKASEEEPQHHDESDIADEFIDDVCDDDGGCWDVGLADFFGFCISGWRQGRILPGEDDHAADAARSERAAAGKGRDEH